MPIQTKTPGSPADDAGPARAPWSSVGAVLGEGRPDVRVERRLRGAPGLHHRERHAAAVRRLRATVHMLARRGDRRGASDLTLQLATIHLTRGRVAEAARWFEHTASVYLELGVVRGAAVARIGLAMAHLEDGAAGAARAALEGVRAQWLEGAPPDERLACRAVQVQGLLLEGRTDSALQLVVAPDIRDDVRGAAPVASGPWQPPVPWASRRVVVASWHAVAALVWWRSCGLEAARPHVEAAVEVAGEMPLARARACGVAARFWGRMGDLERARSYAASALDAARRAGAPLDTLRSRLAWLAIPWGGTVPCEQRTLAERMLRTWCRRVPTLLALERDLTLGEVLSQHTLIQRRKRLAVRRARSLGLAGLPGMMARGRRSENIESSIEALVLAGGEVSSDRAWLQHLVSELVDRLGARGATVVPPGWPGGGRAIASAGRGPWTVLERTMRTREPLGPFRVEGLIQVGVPVWCRERLVGGLGCSWEEDASPRSPERLHDLCRLLAALSGGAVTAVRDATADVGVCPEVVGTSPAMTHVRRRIQRAASTALPVLITGETGVGKELVARAIHRESARRARTFAAINCAALTDDLVDAELFGHSRGAFTGAVAERPGLFEAAHQGTLFLDEVGELSPRAQAKLLRALQEGEVRRVGENAVRPVAVRLVAATNRILDDADGERAFRQDLRYRLDVLGIHVPPLRERAEDIPALVQRFWDRATEEAHSRARLGITALEALVQYSWPGNVRQLQNVLYGLAVGAPRSGVLSADSLADVLTIPAQRRREPRLSEARLEFERRFVRSALARSCGRRSDAACALGLTRQGLAKLLARLGLDGHS